MNTIRYETRLQSRARARAIDINFGIYWLVRDLGTLEFYGLWFGFLPRSRALVVRGDRDDE
jgi:hypothetical protein